MKKPEELENIENDRIRAAVDEADAFHETLKKIKDVFPEKEYTAFAYGMYIGLSKGDNPLSRMAMLEAIKAEAKPIQDVIDTMIKDVQETNKETEHE